MVADMAAYQAVSVLDGECARTWRQGLKHDAAPVMELLPTSQGYRNGLGGVADVEPEYVYPLLKSSDLSHARAVPRSRAVIVPQQRVGEDTRALQVTAPRLWGYLRAHTEVLDARKSSIYRGRPPFSIFGIGDYSFATYKVAVSGLGKNPVFRVLGPLSGRPVMLDDTCYFLPCADAQEAAILGALLNSEESLAFLRAITFNDSKRPVTKKVLQRICLRELARLVGRKAAEEAACALLATVEPAATLETDALSRVVDPPTGSLSPVQQATLPF